MLNMDAVRAVLIALLLPLTGLISLPFLDGSHLPVFWELGVLYTLVFLASTCSQFFNPSSLALTGDLVDELYRARATGLTQMSGSFLREFAEGLRFSFGNPLLFTLLIAGFLVVLYDGAFNTLGVFFWQQRLCSVWELPG